MKPKCLDAAGVIKKLMEPDCVKEKPEGRPNTVDA